jgi:hypothetical protein
VRVVKEMPGCTPPPFYQFLGRLKPTDRIDRWQRTGLPAARLRRDRRRRAAARRAAGLEPRRGPRHQPDDAGRPRHDALLLGIRANFRLDEPGVTEFLRANVGRTFDEDKDMLESQQRNIGTVAEPVFSIAVKADVGPTQGRRLLASMLEAEARGA